jgi:hypothetical protein
VGQAAHPLQPRRHGRGRGGGGRGTAPGPGSGEAPLLGGLAIGPPCRSTAGWVWEGKDGCCLNDKGGSKHRALGLPVSALSQRVRSIAGRRLRSWGRRRGGLTVARSQQVYAEVLDAVLKGKAVPSVATATVGGGGGVR